MLCERCRYPLPEFLDEPCEGCGSTAHINSTHDKPTKDMLQLAVLPMIIYPGCLLANVMSLAGERTRPVPRNVEIAAKTFLYSSTAYPIVLIAAGIVAWLLMHVGHRRFARALAAIPLIYLAFVCCAMLALMMAG